MDRFMEAELRVSSIMDILFERGFDLEDTDTIASVPMPPSFEYAYGATRLVIWDNDNQDYVVKIPRTLEDEKYCVKEVELYHDAVKAGLGQLFGWCEEITCIGEHSIYAMEYLDCDYMGYEDESYEWGYHSYCRVHKMNPELSESQEIYHEYYWNNCIENEITLQWVESTLTEELAEQLERFVEDYCITDIHSGNVGKRDGALVLCDYAGFGW